MAEWGPRFTSDEVPISPYRVFNEMEKVVDVRNTILTHDSGYPRDQVVPFWPVETPRGYIGWGKSTQLGYGLGLAIGAKVAAPEKQVINIMGGRRFRDVGYGHRDGSSFRDRNTHRDPEQRRDDRVL